MKQGHKMTPIFDEEKRQLLLEDKKVWSFRQHKRIFVLHNNKKQENKVAGLSQTECIYLSVTR